MFIDWSDTMQWKASQVNIPSFVRIKPGAIERLGIYARRHHCRHPVLFFSAGLPTSVTDSVAKAFRSEDVQPQRRIDIEDARFETVTSLLAELSATCDGIFGIGGGKCLDVAKYLATLAGRPYYAVPTSLSHDGFCAPQSSLTLQKQRKSLPSALPFAVVVDTGVCLQAPEFLWWSGVGDLMAKLTAIRDWKMAYHERGEPVDDLAALLSTATVYQFIARPARDLEGIRLLATALMLNGISMAMCGSSRPASGAEHLISHALDDLASQPAPHGLQVGVAAYIVSRLQRENSEVIAAVLDKTDFWRGVQQRRFSRSEWLEAVDRAPSIKPDRFTVLSSRPCCDEVATLLDQDERLGKCFTD